MFYQDLDHVGRLLRTAAGLVLNAANACRIWEDGGESWLVGETAEEALCAAKLALDALCSDGVLSTEDAQSRRERFACAGWLCLLAGTDEGGTSEDLDTAAALLFKAADS